MTAEWVVDTWLNELALAPRHQARRQHGKGSRPDTAVAPARSSIAGRGTPVWTRINARRARNERSTNVEQVLQ